MLSYSENSEEYLLLDLSFYLESYLFSLGSGLELSRIMGSVQPIKGKISDFG